MATRTEHHARYEGWRVAAASSVGVFVGFSSLFVYTFGVFLKPIAEEFAWSRQAVSLAFGIAAMTVAECRRCLVAGWIAGIHAASSCPARSCSAAHSRLSPSSPLDSGTCISSS